MSTPSSGPEGGRRRSDVLDAIFDAVEESGSESPAQGSHLFRAKPLAQVDIPKQIDNLLPITSPKLWLAIIGAGVAIAAGLIYAGFSTQVESISVSGRVVAPSGVATVQSTGDLIVDDVLAPAGTSVGAGDPVVLATDEPGQVVSIASPIDGSTWQVLVSSGQALSRGDDVMTVLPTASDRSILVAVDENSARRIRVGQAVRITTATAATTGEVTEISDVPLPAERAGDLVALPLDPAAEYTTVVIATDDALMPGVEAEVEIIQSESSLLSNLVSVD